MESTKSDQPIDRTDRRLLATLQSNGRISLVELAEKIGLSPTAATERLKRLTRDGFILGYSARLDGEPYVPSRMDGGILVAPDRESWQEIHRALWAD